MRSLHKCNNFAVVGVTCVSRDSCKSKNHTVQSSHLESSSLSRSFLVSIVVDTPLPLLS